MAQIEFRMSLQAKLFPLLAQLQGQTVIISERDQTYVPNVNPQDDQNAVDRGIPGVTYAHNVMPSSYGWQSVGFNSRIAGIPGVTGIGELSHVPRTTNGYSTYVAINRTDNRLYILNISGEWINIRSVPEGAVLSVATVRGVSYICIGKVGVFRAVMSLIPSLQEVTLKGLQKSNIHGILTSVGYLLTWSNEGLAWSSSTDPLEFRPTVGDDEVETGAGAGEIQDASGEIIWCQDTSYGMMIYTRGNVVQATWSGNTSYPWNFRGLPNSGGIDSPMTVSKESNGQHWVYTSKGLQQIYHTGAKTVLPFITDFLSGKELDDWDDSVGWFVVKRAAATLKKAISFVSDRYLVLSYGLPTSPVFTHAFIFDTVQARIGKIKYPHVQSFEISNSGVDDREAARDSIGLLGTDGSITSVDFRLSAPNHSGLIILGKFQVARGYMSQMVQVRAENIDVSSGATPWEAVLYPSLDGKEPELPQEGYDHTARPDSSAKTWLFNRWGKNHMILMRGTFNLVSVELTLNVEKGR